MKFIKIPETGGYVSFGGNKPKHTKTIHLRTNRGFGESWTIPENKPMECTRTVMQGVELSNGWHLVTLTINYR